MLISILFIQRKESYEDEYAPEALCCIDEWQLEDGAGKWWQEECDKQLKQAGDDIIAHKIIDVEVDQNQIRSLLVGKSKINGEIK